MRSETNNTLHIKKVAQERASERDKEKKEEERQ